MEKLLLMIEAPSVGQKFDVLVPPEITVEQLRGLLYPLLRDLTNDGYSPSGQELLCRREDQWILPLGVGLDRLNLRTGNHLILF